MIDLRMIPQELLEGENWAPLDIDPKWLWLVKEDDEVVGLLLAANCHGLALILRIKTVADAPQNTVLRLLRRFIRDIRERGCLGYVSYLDVMKPEEAALSRIAYRAGAYLQPFSGVLVIGSTQVKGHA